MATRNDAYSEWVRALAACQEMKERLDAEPPSAKRDASIQLVHDMESRLLMALRNVQTAPSDG
jgi:hypothetical protein